MLIPRFLVWMFSVVIIVVLGTGVVSGQDYPNKPIRIVTSAPGGGADFVARLITPGLTARLGKNVIVDSRGSGHILGEIVSKAPADGYTILVAGPTFWSAPFLIDGLSWDPVRNFSPITLAVSSPNILVVHPSLPVKSVKELIVLAKARPGELNYATGGAGSTPHLGAELFNTMAGVNIVRINYKGGGPALIDLVGGHVQLMFATAASVTPHIQSGKLRALAVTSAKPSALFPGLPTVAAEGLPGYESVNIIGIFTPAKTPSTLIKRLNQEMVRVLSSTDVKERCFKFGVEVVGSSPEELAAAIKSEMDQMGRVIKDARIQ